MGSHCEATGVWCACRRTGAFLCTGVGRDVSCVIVGLLTLGVTMHSLHHDVAPIWAHPGVVATATLGVESMKDLLPEFSRIDFRVTQAGPQADAQYPLLLFGSSDRYGCGAAALQWTQQEGGGALNFGIECNGRRPCPHKGQCSHAAVSGPAKLLPRTDYHCVIEYSRDDRHLAITVDGNDYLESDGWFDCPRDGPISFFSASHSVASGGPFQGEIRELAIFASPPPARTWGWLSIGLIAGTLGLYLGLGALYGRLLLRRDGRTPWQAHAHAELFAHVLGLVRDGCFAVAAGAGLRSASPGVSAGTSHAAKTKYGATDTQRLLSSDGTLSQLPGGGGGAAAVAGQRSTLHAAAARGRANELRTALDSLPRDRMAIINQGDPHSWTAFHVACAGGHASCVQLLLEAGCDEWLLNEAQNTGWDLAEQLKRSAVLALRGLVTTAARPIKQAKSGKAAKLKPTGQPSTDAQSVRHTPKSTEGAPTRVIL